MSQKKETITKPSTMKNHPCKNVKPSM